MKNFYLLVAPYFYSDQKLYARWGIVLLLLLSQCGTAFAYLFIQWNRRFYDALEAKDGQQFLYQGLIFVLLAIIWVAITSAAKYFSQQYAIKWRMWMTDRALCSWVVSSQRGELEGSDQRIQEDLMRFTLLFERFFIDCFNALLLILLFIPLLFSITGNLRLGALPLGWLMLATVIAYTGLGMFISAKIANPLVQLEYDNQKLEAELRYNLVHVRDGATVQTNFFDSMLVGITGNYNLIYKRQFSFNIWQRTYDQFSFLIPFALLASNYFAGMLTLGMLMQIKSTFSRIRNSMAYLLDHYTELTEMAAISKRLVEFYQSMDLLDQVEPNKVVLSS